MAGLLTISPAPNSQQAIHLVSDIVPPVGWVGELQTISEVLPAFGFSARHWQQIEAGRPITMRTLLRICDAFKVRILAVVRDTDEGIYDD
jgi:hypothetical protein